MRGIRRFALVVVACGMAPLFVAPVASADTSVTTCTGSFTGRAENLVVPPSTECDLQRANIANDVTVQTDSILLANNSTIGHDLNSQGARNIITGTTGPVKIGNALSLTFTSDSFFGGFNICQTTVGSDLTVFANSLGSTIDIGDTGTGCSPDSIGRDLVVFDNTVSGVTGNGAINIGNNRIGRDLILSSNDAASYIEVADNTVGRDANCSGPNFPPPSKDGPEDGPNHVGRIDTCD